LILPWDAIRGDRHEPVNVRPGPDGERVEVTGLGLLEEVAIHPIVLPASIGDALRFH
jgi:hypothetical protein